MALLKIIGGICAVLLILWGLIMMLGGYISSCGAPPDLARQPGSGPLFIGICMIVGGAALFRAILKK